MGEPAQRTRRYETEARLSNTNYRIMTKATATFRYILSIHLFALFTLLLIRFILLINNYDNIADLDNRFSLIPTAFLKGLWFDNSIACYISSLPLLVMSIAALCNKIIKPLTRFFSIYYIVLFGLVFAISMADIPYFAYFYKHIDSSILNWKEEGGEAAMMIFQEATYYLFFAIYIALMICFAFEVLRFDKKLTRKSYQNLKKKDYYLFIPLTLLLMGACFFGIRGRLGMHPIRTSQAYFCDNSFLNQMGLNPTFYLMRDLIENNKKHASINDLVSEEDAIATMQEYLGCDKDSKFTSPFARQINSMGDPQDMNVVIIFMESMSSYFLDKQHHGKPLTPYLHKLIEKSYYFDNFYSAGTHTNHGVLATTCGLPSLLDKNAMKNVNTPICQGIGTTLRQQGYNTMFFVSHEAQYDNMMAFLKENGFEHIYAQEDYPKSEIKNAYGVSDAYLFSFAQKKLAEASQLDRPFLASILTITNHPPYILPKEFENIGERIEESGAAYADECIRIFMEESGKQEWYNNTIFVLLGDHGRLLGKQKYDLPLSMNHIPLIIFSPAFVDAPKVFHQMGEQADVFPTIMGLMNKTYINNTLGVDLMKSTHNFATFSTDNMIGCVNDSLFYMYSPKTKKEGLYRYREESTDNIIDSQKAVADSMRIYSASKLRATDYLFKKNLTRISK